MTTTFGNSENATFRHELFSAPDGDAMEKPSNLCNLYAQRATDPKPGPETSSNDFVCLAVKRRIP